MFGRGERVKIVFLCMLFISLSDSSLQGNLSQPDVSLALSPWKILEY